jgi:hypothetical protein
MDNMAGKKKGLSFISNRQRRKEGTFYASELAGIEPTPPAPKGAGYVRLDHHSATVFMAGKNSLLSTIFVSERASMMVDEDLKRLCVQDVLLRISNFPACAHCAH